MKKSLDHAQNEVRLALVAFGLNDPEHAVSFEIIKTLMWHGYIDSGVFE